jgi:hypothetical protein
MTNEELLERLRNDIESTTKYIEDSTNEKIEGYFETIIELLELLINKK